ncbi:MAG: ATP--guanido phosphotransferase, partial [Clostridiales bacterium]|nr:ATP--guanido phosphotransferase [Clostridiales bacterium]
MLKGNINNYAVSSRIRLARNIAGVPFPHKLDRESALQLLKNLSMPLEAAGFKLYPLASMDMIRQESLKERHLISNNLIMNAEKSGVLLDRSEQSAIMINEEDHIRAQVILKGFELEGAYKMADKIDDLIAAHTDIAYDSRYGYITSCPTNLGTGMRASVMMFLPAISATAAIYSLPNLLSKEALTLRGVYGEGSNAQGYMYQLSNQYTLGMSEHEIIANVTKNIYRLAEVEEHEREKLYFTQKSEITDAAMRAWGILTNAYKIAASEFMKLFAEV